MLTSARNKHSLYIIVKFPITSHREPLQLDLYNVISYPVPINSTASHATKIIQLPTYFAVTSHQQYNTTFTTAELATCQHDSTKIFTAPLTKRLHQSQHHLVSLVYLQTTRNGSKISVHLDICRTFWNQILWNYLVHPFSYSIAEYWSYLSSQTWTFAWL